MDSRPSPSVDRPPLQTVLTALSDEDSRRILTTLDGPMSAAEIGSALDIPLSTAYRKLNRLSEASLVAERIDVTTPGKHTTRYVRAPRTVTVTVDETGSIDVSVEPAGGDTADGLALYWGRIRQEL